MLRLMLSLGLGSVLLACGAPTPASTPHATSVLTTNPVASAQAPDAAPAPAGQADVVVPTKPRCVRAGGICVGPAAIAGRPAAPCAAGMHRVDDVKIPGGPDEVMPACYGMRLGEEACCMPN